MAYKPLRLFYVQQKKKITHLDIYLFTDNWALHQWLTMPILYMLVHFNIRKVVFCTNCHLREINCVISFDWLCVVIFLVSGSCRLHAESALCYPFEIRIFEKKICWFVIFSTLWWCFPSIASICCKMIWIECVRLNFFLVQSYVAKVRPICFYGLIYVRFLCMRFRI